MILLIVDLFSQY